jgi:hypothetical protein
MRGREAGGKGRSFENRTNSVERDRVIGERRREKESERGDISIQ